MNARFKKPKRRGFSDMVKTDYKKATKIKKISTQNEWSIMVRARDGNKCVDCGIVKHLTAHHIKPKSNYPQLRFDINNGVSLCRLCHDKREEFKNIHIQNQKQVCPSCYEMNINILLICEVNNVEREYCFCNSCDNRWLY